MAGAGGAWLLPSDAGAQGLAGAAGDDSLGVVGAIVTAKGIAGLVLRGRTRAGGRGLSFGDRWHLGSNGKAMTAALYARLASQGRVAADASVAALFAGIAGVAVDRAWAGVSVRQLMGHAAGVSDAGMDQTWLVARHADVRPAVVQRAEFAAGVLARPPAGTVGRYAYGNASYLLLGAGIERALRLEGSGTDWEAAMRTELFAPLGIASAGFGAPPRDGPWGHQEVGSGVREVDPAGVADNPAVMGPAGRVHMTMTDYARFLGVFLGGRAPLLSRAGPDRLIAVPAASGYAGGWSVSGAGTTEVALSHEGSNTLWYAVTEVRPERGLAYAVVVNRGGVGGRAAALAMMEELRRRPI